MNVFIYLSIYFPAIALSVNQSISISIHLSAFFSLSRRTNKRICKEKERTHLELGKSKMLGLEKPVEDT